MPPDERENERQQGAAAVTLYVHSNSRVYYPFNAVCFTSGGGGRAVILEVRMSLFTQLLGDQIPAAENTKSADQDGAYHHMLVHSSKISNSTSILHRK